MEKLGETLMSKLTMMEIAPKLGEFNLEMMRDKHVTATDGEKNFTVETAHLLHGHPHLVLRDVEDNE
jgi:hypothetical protein